MKTKILLTLATISLFSSCKVYFTEDLRNRIESNGYDLSKVQFYTSKEIYMTREINSSEAKLSQGQVKFEKGQYLEIIQIKKGTPGKCESASKGNLTLSFELGPNRRLNFENKEPQYPLNTYSLKPDNCDLKKYSRNISIGGVVTQENFEEKICKISYDGKTYQVKYFNEPELLIKKKEVRRRQVKKRVAKGVRVK